MPEACDNTLLIAERADVQIELGKPSLPEFPVPDRFSGETYEERALAYLRDLTYEGARERYGLSLPDDVVERLDYELGVIADLGFSAYFLVARKSFSRCSARGRAGRFSAAGCCVAYCLEIVNLNHFSFSRPSEQDAEHGAMDFDERYRADVMRYTAEKYGSDRVAQVITFSTIKARAAVRGERARVLGKPYIVGDRIAKAMPPLVMGREHAVLRASPRPTGTRRGSRRRAELRTMRDTDPDAKEVIEVAVGLEGLRRQDGIHAAAVVISREVSTDGLPAHSAQARRRRESRRRGPSSPNTRCTGSRTLDCSRWTSWVCATSRSWSGPST